MLPAARTFCPAAGFLCFNRGENFFRKNGAPERPQTLRCSETKWDLKDAQSERGAHSKSSYLQKRQLRRNLRSCLFAFAMAVPY
jgi:hypothetical protein